MYFKDISVIRDKASKAKKQVKKEEKKNNKKKKKKTTTKKQNNNNKQLGQEQTKYAKDLYSKQLNNSRFVD